MSDITEGGKYYIPTIEEFHVGFEYQTNSIMLYRGVHENGVWSETIKISIDDFIDETIADIGWTLEHDENKHVRVKHLDHDDIVECGWITEIKALCKYCWGSYDLFCSYNYAFFRITSKTGTPIDITLFSGRLRNKSELQRLMRQLGITV